ncbi:DsbA family oxidoreductase [Actinobacillus equuli]|uniref:DsbA family oxidoreductase n=1 Tax=Actinobacillus equuli TaxID=718 RepID=UPI0024422276|nr:DsbA family oxidoreductase [Actinobacillus equuli]WGE52904.1 DsbA family oxidoreductase [Actinobacillus equuli subsp. haemolyticus]
MKLEIWSDYACPFCYVATRHLEKALAQFPHRESIEIVHKSYRLHPNVAKTASQSMQKVIEQNYRKSSKEAEEMIEYINQAGRNVGLDMQFENAKDVNTFDAHRLLKWAKTQGQEEPLSELMFKAFFSEGLSLADHSVLAELAEQAGLDRTAALAFLQSDSESENVRSDEQEAYQLGVQGVPFFVFDRQMAFSGAQPPETFLQVFNELYQAQHIEPEFATGASCGIDGCK